jgi:hypothetical protein
VQFADYCLRTGMFVRILCMVAGMCGCVCGRMQNLSGRSVVLSVELTSIVPANQLFPH